MPPLRNSDAFDEGSPHLHDSENGPPPYITVTETYPDQSVVYGYLPTDIPIGISLIEPETNESEEQVVRFEVFEAETDDPIAFEGTPQSCAEQACDRYPGMKLDPKKLAENIQQILSSFSTESHSEELLLEAVRKINSYQGSIWMLVRTAVGTAENLRQLLINGSEDLVEIHRQTTRYQGLDDIIHAISSYFREKTVPYEDTLLILHEIDLRVKEYNPNAYQEYGAWDLATLFSDAEFALKKAGRIQRRGDIRKKAEERVQTQSRETKTTVDVQSALNPLRRETLIKSFTPAMIKRALHDSFNPQLKQLYHLLPTHIGIARIADIIMEEANLHRLWDEIESILRTENPARYHQYLAEKERILSGRRPPDTAEAPHREEVPEPPPFVGTTHAPHLDAATARRYAETTSGAVPMQVSREQDTPTVPFEDGDVVAFFAGDEDSWKTLIERRIIPLPTGPMRDVLTTIFTDERGHELSRELTNFAVDTFPGISRRFGERFRLQDIIDEILDHVDLDLEWKLLFQALVDYSEKSRGLINQNAQEFGIYPRRQDP